MSDPYASYAAATLMLAALAVRDQTGQSVYLDLSQRDAAVRLIGDEFLAYQMGVEVGQWNNGHRQHVPNRAYRCLGDDRWVTIAARTDGEWRALCDVIERPDLREDEGLLTADGRRGRLPEVDEAIEAWTAIRDPQFVETQMLRAGVPAAFIRRIAELIDHPQYAHREFFPWTSHPYWGERRLHTTPVMLRGRPATRTDRRPPVFNEHTREVLSGVVGLSEAEIAELAAEGAAGGEPDTEGVVVISG
jgi:benzylsuccinate CoA-transferase BbsF subunit